MTDQRASTVELTDLVYKAAIEPGLWQDVLPKIGAAVSADAGIMVVPPVFGAVPITIAMFGVNFSDALAKVATPIIMRATLTNNAVATGRAPGVFDMDGLLESNRRDNDEVWRAYEEIKWTAGIVTILRTPADADGAPVIMNFFKSSSFAPEAFELVEGLFPHLRRALDLGLSLNASGRAASEMQALLDGIPDASVLVGEELHIAGSNKAADTLLGSAAGIEATADGMLKFSDKAADARCRAAVKRSISFLPFHNLEGGRQEFLAGSSGRARRIVAIVTPARPLPSWNVPARSPIALVRLIDLDRLSSEAQIRRLRELFGLTTAETEIASEIATGRKVEQIAATRGVSEGTVRLQLKSIFGKLGVNSQSALAAVAGQALR